MENTLVLPGKLNILYKCKIIPLFQPRLLFQHRRIIDKKVLCSVKSPIISHLRTEWEWTTFQKLLVVDKLGGMVEIGPKFGSLICICQTETKVCMELVKTG